MSITRAYTRVATEHEVLWENIERLQAFRDGDQPSDVSDYQWKLLKKQLKAMRKYNKILALRQDDLYAQAFSVEFNETVPVTTPGQSNKKNINVSAFHLQSDEKFMKDNEKVLLEHY